MKNIVIDEVVRSKLGEVTEEVELCDEAGRIIGVLMPRKTFYRLLLETPEAQVSEEELERSFAEPGGKTLREIKQELGME